ncbi:helix-turn-helix domain-containing protein [Rhodococcus chondri]|uniref:Helix-turn-helix domain-containing protein n=1 Tax=Rhodococcus chondri TaxID=3065941 RepID=A0ABU7JT75_9NOCA|nr:helix-turn-helix domain-containing protein [Rhodococcus sp. CC-R104]MEE2032487.1 helix-turn-helix domain-containing protein [Rhodococcus sp. CC-R104]
MTSPSDALDAAESAAGPRPERHIDIYRRAASCLEACLPLGWNLSSDRPRSPEAPKRLVVTAPDGESASFAIITSRGVLSGDVARITAELSESDRGFVCAHYLSDPVRRQLDQHGISYADATGNLALVAARPAIWVRNRGADADPWRGPGRPSGVLTGEPSDRVVRALADHVGDMTVPELIKLSGSSTGATYRVVEVLTEREFVRRIPRGHLTTIRWEPMLRAWAAERKVCATRHFTAPQGLDAVRRELTERIDISYALTGIGATDYAAPEVLEVYADDPDEFAGTLGLRPLERGGDVVVAIPWTPVVFERMDRRGGLRYAAPAHVYADLLAGPFRNRNAAEHLLAALTSDESRWRRPVH